MLGFLKNLFGGKSVDYAELVKNGAQIIDVRTPAEFNGGHVKGAKNVPLQSLSQNLGKINKNKPVITCCASGARSAAAKSILQNSGFTEVYNLEGGIMKWTTAGMPKAGQTAKTGGMTVEDYQKLVASDKKVLINFTAVWCAPCQKMKPYILKMQEELKDQVKIVRVDADENKGLTEAMKIEGLPMIIIYENGKEVWRNLGYISEEDLKKHL